MEGVPRHRVVIHRARSLSLVASRRARWLTHPADYPTPRPAALPVDATLVWDARIPLRRSDPHAEPVFEAGKQVNVALAAPAFDRLRLDPGVPLSFWRTLGRPRRSARPPAQSRTGSRSAAGSGATTRITGWRRGRRSPRGRT